MTTTTLNCTQRKQQAMTSDAIHFIFSVIAYNATSQLTKIDERGQLTSLL